MSEQTAPKELGWNDAIQNDGNEFIILPEGDYPFEVKKFERTRFNGSAKLPACPAAKLTILVGDRDCDQVTITHNLFLSSVTEGLLCQFFKSIGSRKHGERMVMDWNKVVGAKGYCHVFIEKFIGKKDGKEKESNKIKKFLDPDEMAKKHNAAESKSDLDF